VTKPLIRDRNVALYLGLVMTLAGAALLHDAWEARGHKRPWAMRLVSLAG